MPPLSFRHEDSFRGVINFNRIVLSPENFDTAHQAFERFTKLYEDGELELQPHRGYKKITLIRETFHHCKDRDAFLQHFFTAIGVMHYRDTAMGFAQGLSAIEDFISQPPAEHQARLLSDYADDLLIFYAKSKPDCLAFRHLLFAHVIYYSEGKAYRRCYKVTKPSLQKRNTQWTAQGDTSNRLLAS